MQISFKVGTVLLLTASCLGRAATFAPTNVIAAARAQIGMTVRYDPAYRQLPYPKGDVPLEAGVCTDVVIRALRAGPGIDLQQKVHEDMKANFALYPRKWGLSKPDPNIDHRRVLNLQVFFQRAGWAVGATNKARTFQPGDLVTCIVPPNLPHIMIVSDRTNRDGRHLVLHNIGSGTKEEDRLTDFRITGQYRLPTTTNSPASVGVDRRASSTPPR